MVHSRDSCSTLGCRRPPCDRLYKGNSYCLMHYKEQLTDEFKAEFAHWNSGSEPSSRLRNLFGRLTAELWKVESGLMSAARLRDRGFNFEKTENGCTFEITRHPGAFSDGYVTRRIVQKWKVDADAGVAACVNEREWTEGDPD